MKVIRFIGYYLGKAVMSVWEVLLGVVLYVLTGAFLSLVPLFHNMYKTPHPYLSEVLLNPAILVGVVALVGLVLFFVMSVVVFLSLVIREVFRPTHFKQAYQSIRDAYRNFK